MLRIATIGTSGITSDFIEEVNAHERAQFVGTLSRSAERAQAFTSERGGTRAFTQLEELATSDEVDAVYLGSPNALHAKQALACIAGGKHVIAEKPLASNEREAREVFEAAERAGVVVLEAMRPLHDPAFAKVAELTKKIGAVRYADLRIGNYSSRYDELLAGNHTNIFDCTMSTGALMDMGVYTVEPLIELFGAPDSICASGVLLTDARELTHGPLDGAGAIVARYADKVVVLHYSKITNDNLPTQVEGEAGTLTFKGISIPEQAQIAYHGVAIRSTAKQVRKGPGGHIERFDLPTCANTMCYELDDFIGAVEAVQAGTTPLEAPAGPFGTVAHYRDVTCSSLALMDEARRQMGVAFPADEPAREA